MSAEEKFYTTDEVRKHTSRETGIWITMNGNVYDITSFIMNSKNKHPDTISPFYGEDVTGAFRGIVHSKYARKLLSQYKIGELKDKQFGDGQIPVCDISNSDPIVHVPVIKAKDLTNIRITKICMFPIKGCKYISVPRAYIKHDGLLHDRQYAFVNTYNKKVVNQLFFPQLALIQPAFMDPNIDNFDAGIKINDEIVPLINTKESELFVTWRSSTTPIKVYDQGATISKWITNYIHRSISGYEESISKYGKDREFILVRIAKDNHREAARLYSVMNAGKANNIGGFQNYYTVSVVSQESFNECNRRLKVRNKVPLTWRNQGFRLNIIISGVPAPHYEDYMKNIEFINNNKSNKKENKNVECVWSRRRYLCAVPCVNQESGKVSTEPMETLATYRDGLHLNDRIAPPGDESVYFGSFFAIKQAGWIEVGMPICVKYQQLDSHRIMNNYFGFNKKYQRFKQRQRTIKSKL